MIIFQYGSVIFTILNKASHPVLCFINVKHRMESPIILMDIHVIIFQNFHVKSFSTILLLNVIPEFLWSIV